MNCDIDDNKVYSVKEIDELVKNCDNITSVTYRDDYVILSIEIKKIVRVRYK